MLKKVWFMLVLLSVLMVSGCFGGMQKDNTDSVAVTADVVAVDNSDTSVGTEQTETSETEKQSGNSFNVEASNTEESTADTTTTEIDAEPPTTEAPSEPETVTTQPATPPMEQQPTTPEQTTPSTEATVTEEDTEPATDDRGNPADGSPVFEITFNIPQAEYVGYDADRVARLAVEKCKAAGMIALPENLDRLLAEGKIQKECIAKYGKEVPEYIINEVIETGDTKAIAKNKESIMDTINAGLRRYALEVEAKLRELKIDFDFTNVVYVGGGAGVMRRFGRCIGENVRYVTDVRANALGYQYLAQNLEV